MRTTDRRPNLAALALMAALGATAVPEAQAQGAPTITTTAGGQRIPYGLHYDVWFKNCPLFPPPDPATVASKGFLQKQPDGSWKAKPFYGLTGQCFRKDANGNPIFGEAVDTFNELWMPFPPGHYKARIYARRVDDERTVTDSTPYVASYSFEVYRDKLCRDFTTTARYKPLYLTRATLGGLGISQSLIDQFNANALAYFQLKGNWCYFGGSNFDQVVKYRNLRLETAVTGPGLSSFTFKIRPGTTGSITLERYGTTASRYRIAGTTAIVSVSSPVDATLTYTPPAGFNGPSGTVTVKAGQTVDLYTLRTDTLLTGSGYGECAGTQNGPCDVKLQAPTRFY